MKEPTATPAPAASDENVAPASLIRRVAALALDWFAASMASRLLIPGLSWGTQGSAVAVLGIFYAEVTLLTWLMGASFGQRLLGIEVAGLGNGLPQRLLRAGLRTLLICLVIPAVIMDADGRGLHDRIMGTRVVRT